MKPRFICTACRPYKMIVRGLFLDHIRDKHPEIYLNYVHINQAILIKLKGLT